MHDLFVPQFVRALKNLKVILRQGEAHAQAKKIDPAVLLETRLIADQFPLVRQVQISCDTAKLAAARLAGVDAPVHSDTEKSFEELYQRIDSVIGYLEGFAPAAFAQASERKITQPRWEGKWLTGSEYLHCHAMPNIYFHVTTAYAILRANGVEVGKKTFLGELPFKQ